MAYSQRAHYGEPRRPYAGQPDHSYDSSYSRGHGPNAGDQGYGYNGGYGGGSDGYYPNQYAEQDHYGYEQPGWSEPQRQRDNGYHDGDGHAGPYRPPQAPNPTGYRPSEPWSRGAPPTRSRSPMNGYHERNDRQRPPRREHQQQRNGGPQYDRYQNVVPPQPHGSYEHGDAFDEQQNGWRERSEYDHDHGHGHAGNNAHSNGRHRDYQQQSTGYGDGYGQTQPKNRSPSAPHSRQNPAEISKSNPARIVPKHEEPPLPKQPPKQPPKRILDDMKSPDTLAWDNPFPTFPAAKSKSKAQSEAKEHSRNGNASPKPPAANDQSSHNSAHEVRAAAPVNDALQDDYSQHLTDSQNVHGHETHAQGQTNSSRSRFPPRRGDDSHIHIPGPQGRHSEDNRLRPAMANEVVQASGYERSHTMPTAITDAIMNPHDEMPEVAAWQEPGATAGYHGGEDKGFVHSPTLGPSQHKPPPQPRAHSDETRQHQPRSRFPPAPVVQTTPLSPPDAQQDRVGEVFDAYFDSPQSATKPYVKENPYQPFRRSLDEMPNFSAAQVSTASYGSETAIDQHLQPQPTRHVQASTIPQQEHYYNQGQQSAYGYAADPVPRSRSQPDYNGHQPSSHRQQQEHGFEIGVSRPGDRRPATSSSNSRPGPRGNPPLNSSSDRPYQSPQPGAQRQPGPGPVYEQQPQDRYRGDNRPRDPGPVNRHQFPPRQNGYTSSRPQEPYHSGSQDRYRSPQQNGPSREPGQRDRYQSPPVQGVAPPDGRGRRSGGGPGTGPGGPSPNGRNGLNSANPRPPPNPDALPHHPAPVRPGLMEPSSVNSSNKPPPVRQYNNNAPAIDLGAPADASEAERSKKPKRGSDPVTYQELDRLRQKTQKSPEDQATRFILAKKLIEASTVLVNERADPKSREKARDDYNAQALKLLKKLSGNQYPEAMFYLGDCYSRGALGLQADVKEAFTLYQSAAKANHAQAAYRVAVCCELGQDEGGGTRKDPVKAMQWYKRAAQLGDVPAMYKMGIIQLKGLLGQPRNPREALVFLKKAAELADAENPHALHELALLHEKGGDGVPKDERYSRDLFMKCANLGYKFSQYRLGCAYEYGLMGCPVDPRQSIAWYSKAAVQEEHQSELALSGWYLTGSEGVLQQSDTEAYLWARKAAQAGLAKAEYAMGYFTEVGIGAPANLEDAKRWYWRAASQNFPKARERLEDLRKGGAAKQKTRVSRSHMKKQSDGDCSIM